MRGACIRLKVEAATTFDGEIAAVIDGPCPPQGQKHPGPNAGVAGVAAVARQGDGFVVANNAVFKANVAWCATGCITEHPTEAGFVAVGVNGICG